MAVDIIGALKIASVIMSIIIAFFIFYRCYIQRRKETHLLFWAIAWLVVGIRVMVHFVYLPGIQENAPFYFIADVLIVGHDLLWFIGLAIVLDFDKNRKVYFPLAYFAITTVIIGILYFVVEDLMLAAAQTNMLAHPILLFILFWYFYVSAKESGRWGTSLVAASFLLWALDFIIFGIPYFGMGNKLAGQIGWYLGFVFRTMIFIGFILMIKSPYETEADE